MRRRDGAKRATFLISTALDDGGADYRAAELASRTEIALARRIVPDWSRYI
jgi:hypothetical protein